MKNFLLMALAAILLPGHFSPASLADSAGSIDVFYKDRDPSLKTLKKTTEVLKKYAGTDKVSYHLITDPSKKELMKKYNLPESHFPFAIVIDGKHSARLGQRTVTFIEFPLFMKGIGRHEGHWSMKDLEHVLQNRSLLIDDNTLPASLQNHEHHDEPCPGEKEEGPSQKNIDS